MGDLCGKLGNEDATGRSEKHTRNPGKTRKLTGLHSTNRQRPRSESLSTQKKKKPQSIISLQIFRRFWCLSLFLPLPDFVWTSEAAEMKGHRSHRYGSVVAIVSSTVSLPKQLTCNLALNMSHRPTGELQSVRRQLVVKSCLSFQSMTFGTEVSWCLFFPLRIHVLSLVGTCRFKATQRRALSSLIKSRANVASTND